jgi:RNA polymerase sigma factor (sigma-70 family)
MIKKAEEDALLWSRFKSGDRNAFAALYQRYAIPLIAYGMRLCPDRDQLKDQIQELFVELWNSRGNLADTDSVKFYLFRALRYKLIRLEKRREAKMRAFRMAADTSGKFQEDSVETVLMNKETHESHMALLRSAIGGLSLREQEVIQLRFYQGFTNEQIAELMCLNYQSASNLLYRALCRLKDIIKIPAVTASFLACSLLIS